MGVNSLRLSELESVMWLVSRELEMFAICLVRVPRENGMTGSQYLNAKCRYNLGR